MTDDADWISLSQVHSRLTERLGSQATGEVLLLEALRSGKISIAADYYMGSNPHPDRMLSADNFRDAQSFIWKESRVEHRVGRSSLGPKGQTYYHMGDFHRVRCSYFDVNAVWPELFETEPRDMRADLHENKNKGGRPAKYDWAAAGGALAGYMYGAGVQESSKLKLFMIGWFRSQLGKSPDERDVEKFVAAALAAFDQAAPKA